ncbi:MAG: hypothetical protein DRI57_03540 [Deltaproteobacteria bacterium]|nr:MAG: hypothetical protein DRI57_03540 [Deltaproteobacteria bacterium]
MEKQFIELEEGIIVQVTVPENEVRRVSRSRGGEITKVEKAFDTVKDLIVKGCKPLTETWKLVNQEMKAESAEVEFGISFTGKGSVYLVESSAQASLKVKINWKFE